jgi:hypothetical protein
MKPVQKNLLKSREKRDGKCKQSKENTGVIKELKKISINQLFIVAFLYIFMYNYKYYFAWRFFL